MLAATARGASAATSAARARVRACARARVDGDHGAVVAEGHHERLGSASGECSRDDHSLLGELAADELAREVLAERRHQRRAQTEPYRRDRGDRAAARGAQQVAREALLAERRQRLETDDGQVQEGGGRDHEVDAHGRPSVPARPRSRRPAAAHLI